MESKNSSYHSFGNTRNPDTHRAILDAARRLLATNRYSAITIEKIAQLSKAGKPTIYRWWPNKAALFMEIYNEDAAKLLVVTDVRDFKQELLLFFQGTWKLWRDSVGGQAYRSILAEVQSDAAAFAFFKETFLPKRHQPLIELFERAKARGEIKNDIGIESFISLVFGFNWYHLLTDETPSPEELKEIVQFLITSLRGR